MRKFYLYLAILFGIIGLLFVPHLSNADAIGPSYPLVKELFKVTESIDDRNLAKKALINELGEKVEALGEELVTEEKRLRDQILSKTGDVTNRSLHTRDSFVIYAYYALKDEYPINGIPINWQNLFSPLKQSKEGNPPGLIQCYGELVKIVKNTDGSANCTTLETALILVERNFGTSEDVARYHEIESVRNCESDKIFHYIGLGSFSITIEDNTFETCNVTFVDEIEGGVIERSCEIPFRELQNFQGWEKDGLPKLEGFGNYCEITKNYSIWDIPNP